MSERKAYRIRQAKDRDANDFAPIFTGHPYLAIPWPEDCPWGIEDFPLPGEKVRNKKGGRWKIVGPPFYSPADGEWQVTISVPSLSDRIYHIGLEEVPSIWNARKDATDERVVGTLTISDGNYMDLQSTLPPTYSGVHQRIMHSPLSDGKYDIVRGEDS